MTSLCLARQAPPFPHGDLLLAGCVLLRNLNQQDCSDSYNDVIAIFFQRKTVRVKRKTKTTPKLFVCVLFTFLPNLEYLDAVFSVFPEP